MTGHQAIEGGGEREALMALEDLRVHVVQTCCALAPRSPPISPPACPQHLTWGCSPALLHPASLVLSSALWVPEMRSKATTRLLPRHPSGAFVTSGCSGWRCTAGQALYLGLECGWLCLYLWQRPQTHTGGQWLLWFLSKLSPVEDESCREHPH